jgi:TolB protein
MVNELGDYDPTTLAYSPDRDSPQLFVRDNQFQTSVRLPTSSAGGYDPAWSPAGDRIAFVSEEAGNDEIYSINPDGSDLRRLTTNTWEWDKHPSWSPDGTQIIFWSNRGSGRRQIWIMNADGSNQRPLLDSGLNDWDPIWVK